MEAQNFNIGDVVIYNSMPYKIKHIRDGHCFKLQSIRGKTNEIIFNVPIKFIQKESESDAN